MMATPHTLIEGVIITSLRDPAANHAFIYVRGEVVHVVPPAAARGRGGLRGRATSARTSSAPASTSRSPCTPAPAPTSAARRRRCSTRSRAAAASRGCGRRSPRSPASTPARRWSTTSSRSPSCPAIVDNGADWFTVDGHREVARASASSRCPATSRSPASTRRRSASRCASCSTWPAACASGHELKFWTPGGSSTPMLTAEHLDVPLDFESRRRRRLDARHPRAADLRRDHLRGARRAALDRVLHARVVRQVHARAARAPTGWCRSCSGSSRAQGSEADLDKLLDICDNILGRSFCALGDGATSPITSSIQYFRDEYLAHLDRRAAAPSTPTAATAVRRPRERRA